jgi:hypothetical protein
MNVSKQYFIAAKLLEIIGLVLTILFLPAYLNIIIYYLGELCNIPFYPLPQMFNMEYFLVALFSPLFFIVIPLMGLLPFLESSGILFGIGLLFISLLATILIVMLIPLYGWWVRFNKEHLTY